MGLAFQIVDDILDIVGAADVSCFFSVRPDWLSMSTCLCLVGPCTPAKSATAWVSKSSLKQRNIYITTASDGVQFLNFVEEKTAEAKPSEAYVRCDAIRGHRRNEMNCWLQITG